MNRARFIFAAALVGASLMGGSVIAQIQAPELKPVLAGRKFTPPLKGQADVEFTRPVTKREKDMIVTRITVRNASDAAIPRLTVDETWYDKSGGLVIGGKGVLTELLQPGEVKTIEIHTPYSPKMSANNFNFSHANGTVKPTRVDKLVEAEKEPATKQATGTKKK